MQKSALVDNKKERYEWVDALKAMAIAFVVFGHQVGGINEYFLVTSPIKMPIFFIISGFLFKRRDGKISTFFKNILFRLIIPWLLLGSLFSIIQIPIKGIDQFYNNTLLLISGQKLWFMPAFIIGQLIFFILCNTIKKETVLILVSVIIGIFGLKASSCGILRYALVDIALTVQIFFVLGYELRNNSERFFTVQNYAIPIGGLLYIIMLVISLGNFRGQIIDIHKGMYYDYTICFSMIFIGCLTIISIAHKINGFPKIINLIGQNTFVIYLINGYITSVVAYLFKHIGMATHDNLFYATITTTISLLVCTGISILMTKYTPWLNGSIKFNKI